MDKSQAINSFWNSFGLTAYDENNVPHDAKLPYITYSMVDGTFENPVSMTASIWDRSTSWVYLESKKKEVSERIGSYLMLSLDNNQYAFITKGNPFAQRLSHESNDTIKRIYVNINVEYLTFN